MSIDRARTNLTAAAPVERRFDELDRVAIREAVETDGGRLPAGATGTVVAVWAGGDAYEVEFVRPFAALATLRPAQLRGIAAA